MSTTDLGHPGLSAASDDGGMGAASTLAASSEFATRALRLGSARAKSSYISSPISGPTPFRPGEVTTGTAMVKLAHSIIAGRSRRATDDLNRKLAMQSYEMNERIMQATEAKLLQPEVTYTTKDGMTFRGADAERAWALEHPADKAATPEVEEVNPFSDIPGIPKGTKVPRGLLQSGVTIRGQNVGDARARDLASIRITQQRHYNAAQAGLKNLDAKVDELANADVNTYHRTVANQLLDYVHGTNTNLQARAKRALGISSIPIADPVKRQQVETAAVNDWLKQQFVRRKQYWQMKYRDQYRSLRSVAPAEGLGGYVPDYGMSGSIDVSQQAQPDSSDSWTQEYNGLVGK